MAVEIIIIIHYQISTKDMWPDQRIESPNHRVRVYGFTMTKARNPYARLRMRVRIRQKSKFKDI